jgi:signal transduction histidine kinase/DNA-binding response OmpR family regulator
MTWIKTVLSSDTERELLYSTSRSIIFMMAGIYTVWHFIATLTWPEIFSPSLWASSIMMLVIVAVAVRLLENNYLLAQMVWLGGLMMVIFQAYATYQRPEVLLLLVFLPLMAIMTVGYYGTALTVVLIILTMILLPGLLDYNSIPNSYFAGVILGSCFTTLFGWGLANNLFTAIDSSSFHFQEARKNLEEARHHQAEVSRMLKELNQSNYQLERLNQMLQQARRRAEDARTDRDRFILAVSHELRSPLNFIIGFSDLMVNSPETYAPLDQWPAGLYDDAQEIYRSSKHLLHLINDILDMGQIDARQMTLFREKACMSQLVDDVRKMVRGAFDRKGLTFSVEIKPDIPDVFIDCTRIRQVLLNLVNNGLRFTEQGGVTIRLQRDGNAILTSVIDTGSGIAPEDVPKVFDDFRQVGVDSWRRREGTGLGLSISRRFVQLHGGEMWLESALGKGTRFYFTIPTLEAAPEVEILSGTDELTTPRGFYQRRLRSQEQIVLLCSPDPMAGEILQQWLDEYKIVVVEDTVQLPAQIGRTLPQAVIFDKILLDPRQISSQDFPYEIPVISVVFPDTRGRHALLPFGVIDYLVKPVSRQDLSQAIQQLELANARLLLIDDDPAMVRFVEQTLKSDEHAVVNPNELNIMAAFSGVEALQFAQMYSFDAVLLDLDLPDMSGWDVLTQIQRGQGEDFPPVIIISAHDLPQTLYGNGQDVLEVKMCRPLSQQELPELLKSILKEVRPKFPMAEIEPPETENER